MPQQKIERAVIENTEVGTVVCWRVGPGREQREISASRVGVLVRGRHDSWHWDLNEKSVSDRIGKWRDTGRHSRKVMIERLRRFGGLVALAEIQAGRMQRGARPLPEEGEREFLAGKAIITSVAVARAAVAA